MKDGGVRPAGGPWVQSLHFAYPLAGSFDFTTDAYLGSASEGRTAYAGLLATPATKAQRPAEVWAAGNDRVAARPNRPLRWDEFSDRVGQTVSEALSEPEQVPHVRVPHRGSELYFERDDAARRTDRAA